MSHYAKLGTLAVRFVAIGFFVLTLVSVALALAAGTMGMMMGTATQPMPGGMGTMMQGGTGMWWGSTLFNLVIGVLLYAASRPLGRVMASGLDESAV